MINEINHEHCFHIYRGPIWMVIPDGHVMQKCCKCEATKLVHRDHLFDNWNNLPWRNKRDISWRTTL